MGLLDSSTLEAEPCVSPTCDCDVRLVAQWDLIGGDLRARNIWFRSSSKVFHVSLDVLDTRSDILSCGLFLCPLSRRLHATRPKYTSEWGCVSVPWSGLGLLHVSSLVGLNILGPPRASQDTALPGKVGEAEKCVWGLLPEETLCQDGGI